MLISYDPSKAFPSSLPFHATPYSIYQACSEYSRHDKEVQHLVFLDHIGQTGRAEAYRIWRPYWGHPNPGAAKSFLKAAMR